MANIDLRFLDCAVSDDFIQVRKISYIPKDIIEVLGEENGQPFQILLDKSTAIKLAKTLRTEINKITESEVDNG